MSKICQVPEAGWIMDEEFISSVLSLGKGEAVFSFDIFDTALTRTVESPIDVFAEVERRLFGIHGQKVIGFAEARENAERDARQMQFQRKGAEEVSFQEIYDELPRRLPTFNAWKQAAEIELEVEKEVLYASPDILELIRRLKETGKRVIFVSDMYLPASFLTEVLRNCGYENWDELFVSNEIGATKATGRIWGAIPKKYTENAVHVGDDDWSDVINPKKYGIQTALYARLRSSRRVFRSLSPSILPFSYAQRRVTLIRRSSSVAYTDADRWRDTGRTFGGVVVGSFIKWLEERARVNKIERLYFCSRDGWLIKRAWEAAGLDYKTGIESRYFYISRRPLNLARGFKASSYDKLSPSLLEFLSSSVGSTTIQQALDRAGLAGIPEIIEDAKKSFSSTDKLLASPADMENFRGFLQRHTQNIMQVLAEEYEGMEGYLRQEEFFSPKKLAIVDMGWHATMQRSLSFLRRQELNSHPITGFYYGLWPLALGNRYEAGILESAFASDFLTAEDQPEVHSVVEILEELHSAPHGTVRGYQQSGSEWTPVLAENETELRQYKEMTQHFQDGVLETIEKLFAGEDFLSLKYSDLKRETAVSAMGAIGLAPTEKEVQLLSRISHCATFDHSSVAPLASDRMPAQLDGARKAFFEVGWRVGVLKSWLRNATTEEQKLQIRQLANEHLSYLGERTLRQFS